ncbi:hypothetical protein RFI_01335 [Reticulomyxa filosa]|uniref:Uncharacterized protein n=1 Tax=Reticulomyxa filosa TaxID=46433 RepID=X6PDI2_RETFI|nr:hypothetical protein RFI_01335 [Reticulomyxa filosa]|eukprot:ETO35727.1 hypothetical protein RFI_01335 [Reticulomyxa filosa]
MSTIFILSIIQINQYAHWTYWLGLEFCVKFSLYHNHNHCQNVICSSSYDKTIRFWDFKHNKQLQIFNMHTASVNGIEFSPFNGGKYLCSGSLDKNIRLWDVEVSKSLHVFNGHANGVWCVDISTLICSGSRGNTICFWDIRSNKNQLYVIKGDEDNGIICIKLSQLKKHDCIQSLSFLGWCVFNETVFIH